MRNLGLIIKHGLQNRAIGKIKKAKNTKNTKIKNQLFSYSIIPLFFKI